MYITFCPQTSKILSEKRVSNDTSRKVKFKPGKKILRTLNKVLLLTGRRYSESRFIKWTRFCGDVQLA